MFLCNYFLVIFTYLYFVRSSRLQVLKVGNHIFLALPLTAPTVNVADTSEAH